MSVPTKDFHAVERVVLHTKPMQKRLALMREAWDAFSIAKQHRLSLPEASEEENVALAIVVAEQQVDRVKADFTKAACAYCIELAEAMKWPEGESYGKED